MPVITAAVVAVAAAVATTTVATVATAVVAVSVAIGTVGAVVGTVGMAIGNKDLMFAGKIMGYVGLAGGLAGGVMGGLGALAGATGSEGLTFGQGFADTYASYSQHLSDGWKNGVGSWFSGGDKVAGAAGSTPGTPPVSSSEVAAGKGVNPADFATGGTGPATPVQTPSLTPINTGAIEGTQAPIATPTTAPVAAPTVGGTGAPGVVTPDAPGTLANLNNSASWVPQETTGIVSEATKAAAGMPDWMKYSMMTTGAQGVTGLASGYFQGQQAEDQLAQQQQLNDRNEAYRQELLRNANAIPTFRFSH